ncbi:RES family NAD+ phosphorylase [Larkinella bovis]|uniref:RES family NAD+ phosphorylase n=1 Tax=Larkinella bovis TaxID=683041 RepID=A0ABW0IL54_9BACT
MYVYRIASKEYIEDLSGEGARLYGGRWNREGVAVLYTASSLSLAAWEYWVHLDDSITLDQNAFAAATIEIPDSSILELPPLTPALADNEEYLFSLTDNWIVKNEHLCMKVPSFVIEGEFNYLINPLHPLAKANMGLVKVNSYSFDKRAFGKTLVEKRSLSVIRSLRKILSNFIR